MSVWNRLGILRRRWQSSLNASCPISRSGACPDVFIKRQFRRRLKAAASPIIRKNISGHFGKKCPEIQSAGKLYQNDPCAERTVCMKKPLRIIFRCPCRLFNRLNLQQIGRSGNTERNAGGNHHQIAGLDISRITRRLNSMAEQCIRAALLIDYQRINAP